MSSNARVRKKKKIATNEKKNGKMCSNIQMKLVFFFTKPSTAPHDTVRRHLTRIRLPQLVHDAVSDLVSEFVDEPLVSYRLKHIFLVIKSNRSRQFVKVHRRVFLLDSPKVAEVIGVIDAKLHRLLVDPGDDRRIRFAILQQVQHELPQGARRPRTTPVILLRLLTRLRGLGASLRGRRLGLRGMLL